ncbi:MAG: hypothetical protein KAJ12_09285 [Bacteroidetes bacterium]|nr:hypothetical protein [Bacteroidota bacterium]
MCAFPHFQLAVRGPTLFITPGESTIKRTLVTTRSDSPAATRGMVRAAMTFLLLIAPQCAPLYAQLYEYRTPNMRLVYLNKAHEYVVPHIARSFENSLRFHKNLFDYTPTEEVTVLLHDFNDYGTGGTSVLPWNFLNVGIEPYDYAYETSPTNERFNWVMNHELVHVVATDKYAGADRFFRGIFFGKVPATSEQPLSMLYSYLTTPRWYCPRWYHEGIATFMETWMSGGIGRALGGYDEMVFRTMVRDSAYFYDYVGLESEGTTIDFQIGANAYLYGTRFMSYLAYHYGPEELLRWVNRTEESDRDIASQFEKTFGTSLPEEWSRWIAWEHEWQEGNLEAVREFPLTTYRKVVPEPLGSVSRAFYDQGRRKIFVAMNIPGQTPRLIAIDRESGTVQKLCDVLSPALYYVCSTAYDSSTGSLFYTTHNSSSWRTINVVNVDTRETRALMKEARIGDLAYNRSDRSLWGVQHNNGYSTLVRIEEPYEDWQDILPVKYGKDIYDLDISPDGRYLTTALIEVNGNQQLIRFEIDSLLNGDAAYEVLYEFEKNSPMNFVFSDDGRYLYGTTYYTGVSNAVRLDVESKEVDWLSNTETGFFRPLPVGKDSLMVFRYTGRGFLPVMIGIQPIEDVNATRYLGQQVVERYPIVREWKLDPPSAIDLDSMSVSTGEYGGWSSMNLASAYPILEGYKVYTSIGARADIQDYLGLYALSFSASYSPQSGLPADERLHFYASLKVWAWEFNAAYNYADFYDLFGPTKTSRKGYWLGAKYTDYIVYDRPRTLDYSFALNGFWNLERLPEYQNVPATITDFYTFFGRLRYSFLLRSLGAVDIERGLAWSVNISAALSRPTVYPRIYGTLTAGIPLPWDHSSIWFRGSAGYSPGDRSESLSYFFFGGFGNNWVDHQSVRRYREYYSFPGVELNEIGGTNFGKVMAEWTLPPLRFRSLGLPSLYCTWARLALFGSGVVTELTDPAFRTEAVSLGAQVDFKLVMFTNLSATLSFGYAAAVLNRGRVSREFMISLKI